MAGNWLKRGLPFLLTFVFGVTVAMLFQPVRHVRRHYNYGEAQPGTHWLMLSRNYIESETPFPYDSAEVPVKAHIYFKPDAELTPEAERQGIDGRVVLNVVLGEDGAVHNISIVRGLPYGLTLSAMHAATEIQFTPAMKDGRAVSQLAQITYDFQSPAE